MSKKNKKTPRSIQKRIFVLDTSVLIHDPEAFLHFEEHTVAIPSEVLRELDRIKTESTERGQAARSVQRKLLSLLPSSHLNIPQPLPTGGFLQMLLPPAEVLQRGINGIEAVIGDIDCPDHRIMATTSWLASVRHDAHVVLVTKDMGMMLKGRTAGLEVTDYKYDKAPTEEKEKVAIEVTDKEAHNFQTEGHIELEKGRVPKGLLINSYGLFQNGKRIPWRYAGGGRFEQLLGGNGVQVPGGKLVKARNLEQLYLLDALLNPNIHLVTAQGVAGTGKSLLTLAASLCLIGQRHYTGVCISKPNESVGKENGFLPGTLEEKMRPWLQPYADALNFLHHQDPPQNKRQSQRKKDDKSPTGPVKPYDRLVEAGIVEVTAIEYIRGRSIPNRIFIVDEAQNTELITMKTIASRMAEGSKLVCLGDVDQIDHAYLDKLSNGLSHIRNKMQNLHNAAHITLLKGERSLLAEQAASLL
jgi:PhoH-like ATPase